MKLLPKFNIEKQEKIITKAKETINEIAERKQAILTKYL